MNKVELLAPAGNLQALKAAVENGADAVYLGGEQFSARKNADNFGAEELAEGLIYAHKRHVKVYAAVNTLILNREIGLLLDYVYQLAEAGIDAVIVQDLGAAHLLYEALPELRLHASTQMAVHNSAGVRYLQELGFKRAVLARETSLEHIHDIVNQDIMEIEAFVHGALCVGYSGQCLLSSLIGGRSGNRGQCAQPCRMKYTLVDGQGQALAHQADGDYLLSTRDLMLLQQVPQLIEAGIASLKIEGRMKRPEYVATIVKHYRAAIDQYDGTGRLSPDASWEIRQIFNRDFTTGYYFGKPARDLMSYSRPDNRGVALGQVVRLTQRQLTVALQENLQSGDGYLVLADNGEEIAGKISELLVGGRRVSQAQKGQTVSWQLSASPRGVKGVYKTSDTALLQRAQASYSQPSPLDKRAVHFHITARLGQPLALTAQDEQGHTAQAVSDYVVEQARKHPSDWESIGQQLGRLGNTEFALGRLEGELDCGVMTPASELNKLRREVIQALEQQNQGEARPQMAAYEEYIERAGELLDVIPPKMTGFSAHQLSVTVGTLPALAAAVDQGADLIIAQATPLRGQDEPLAMAYFAAAASYCHQKGARIYLTLSAIQSEEQLPQVRRMYQAAQEAGFDGVLAANAGTFQLAKEMGWETIAIDYPMNITNDAAIQCLSRDEIDQITLSPELNLAQIDEVAYIGNLPTEVIVHGNLPLMISEQCVAGSVLGGRTTKAPCTMPCLKQRFGLRDRLGVVFPLVMDEHCRMTVYNGKTLNLYKRLQSVLDTGIDLIRIEAREREAGYVAEVVSIYRQALDQYAASGQCRYDEALAARLEALDPQGSTFGHYFRGVQ